MERVNAVYVQYGCGLCAPDSWRNFDVSPTLRLQRLPVIGKILRGRVGPVFPPNVEYGDIVIGLPLENGSCRGIYCSHVLEHLSLQDFRTALIHTWNLLEPGGIFRFVLPDLEVLVREYVSSPAPDAALKFMENSYLGKPSRARGARGLVRSWLGNSSHLWMWDFKSMVPELERTGFREIRQAVYGDGKDARFHEVEDVGRWENALGVECVR